MAFLKIVGGIIGVVVVLAIIGGAIASHDQQKQADNVAAKIDSVDYGMSKQDVIDILGEPEDSQHMEMNMPSELGGGTSTNDCIYYGGVFADDMWQLCFDNGELSSKNQY